MNRICWWLSQSLSEFLDSEERDAVCGDLAESEQTDVEALRDVCGVLLRRQAQIWSSWRPWVILVCLITPLGMVLSILARISSGESAVYLWLYANNWDWTLLHNRGFWYVLFESAREIGSQYLTLACLSWTAGFVLGRVSRKLFATNRLLFCLALFFGAILGAPRYFAYIVKTFLTRVENAHTAAPPFRPAPAAQILYGLMFTLMVQVCFVAIPALWAMSQAAREDGYRPVIRKIVWIAAIASIAVTLVRVPGEFVLIRVSPWTLHAWQRQIRWLAPCLSLAVYWPIVYLALKGIGDRMRESKVVLA